MESSQLAQMVAWLDEERRKDKITIAKLEERNSAQKTVIEEQGRKIQELDSAITEVRNRFASINFVDESISRIRNELNTSVEQMDVKRSSITQDLKKMRDTDRTMLQKAIDELRQEMLTRIERELTPRKAEEERLSRVAFELQNYADNLSSGLEEFEHTLEFLEEQRRVESKRINDITEDVKRIDSFDPKFGMLEEISRRNERNLNELDARFADIQQDRTKIKEEQAISDQRREQILADMVKKIDTYGQEMDAHSRQLTAWAETNRQMKKYIEDFDKMTDKIERRVNEITEIQRLSEDRFRKEWDEFIQEDQKRIRQFTVTNEESWRENEKVIKDLQSSTTRLNERGEALLEYVKLLRMATRQLLMDLAERYQAVLTDYEEISFPSITS